MNFIRNCSSLLACLGCTFSSGAQIPIEGVADRAV